MSRTRKTAEETRIEELEEMVDEEAYQAAAWRTLYNAAVRELAKRDRELEEVSDEADIPRYSVWD